MASSSVSQCYLPPPAGFRRSEDRVDDAPDPRRLSQIRPRSFGPRPQRHQIANLDRLEIIEAQAMARGRHEPRKGRVRRPGEDRAKALAIGGIAAAIELQLVESLALEAKRTLASSDLEGDAHLASGGDAAGADMAGGARGESQHGFGLVLVADAPPVGAARHERPVLDH